MVVPEAGVSRLAVFADAAARSTTANETKCQYLLRRVLIIIPVLAGMQPRVLHHPRHVPRHPLRAATNPNCRRSRMNRAPIRLDDPIAIRYRPLVPPEEALGFPS